MLALLHGADLVGEPLPSGAELFDRHFAAMGGRAAVAKVQNVVVQGKAREGDQAFEFALQLKAPGLVLLTASNAAGFVIRTGRDGEARWWRQDPGGVSEPKNGASGEFMELVIGFHLPSQIGLSAMLKEAVSEVDRDGDRAVFAIGRKDEPGPLPRLWFDQTSGLLVRAGRTAFDDYRVVEGIRVPFVARSGGPVRLTVERIAFNEPIADTVFDRPAQASAAPSREGRSLPDMTHTRLSRPGQLEIVRRPSPADFGRGQLDALPKYDPNSTRHAQIDLRGYDLTRLDLVDRLADLLHADFDSRTRWPDRLPAGFDRDRIVALGKDPGLGVRQLHARGITGKGIGLGIIDQTLLVDHVEYRDCLRLYEEIHAPSNAPAQMHGPAVASIAVGRTMGVAPDAHLYYIAEQHGIFRGEGKFDWDFTWLAQSIERLLDVNASLPPDRKIRVISISVGWSPDQKGYAETVAAVTRAKRDGVFIVSTSIEQDYQLAFHGLGREALSDPNDFNVYGPGSWWGPMFWGGQQQFAPGNRLLVPMDCRALASPTGTNDYVFYWSAGWSWSVPWIAGLYALACQIRPDLTPDVFWAEALKTGRTTQVRRASTELAFGTVADPVALIDRLSQPSRP
jgi:hypothetical protein